VVSVPHKIIPPVSSVPRQASPGAAARHSQFARIYTDFGFWFPDSLVFQDRTSHVRYLEKKPCPILKKTTSGHVRWNGTIRKHKKTCDISMLFDKPCLATAPASNSSQREARPKKRLVLMFCWRTKILNWAFSFKLSYIGTHASGVRQLILFMGAYLSSFNFLVHSLRTHQNLRLGESRQRCPELQWGVPSSTRSCATESAWAVCPHRKKKVQGLFSWNGWERNWPKGVDSEAEQTSGCAVAMGFSPQPSARPLKLNHWPDVPKEGRPFFGV